NKISLSLHDALPIFKDFSAADISAWAEAVKTKPDILLDQTFYGEVLAVLRKASILHNGYDLRAVQLISIFSSLYSHDQGILLQIDRKSTRLNSSHVK